jgi:hypothetical protein
MTADADGLPWVARSARGLGVRPGTDVQVQPGDLVLPGTGGMSGSLDAVTGLPPHRRPPRHGGTGRDPVWGLDTAAVPSDLALLPDGPPHHVVEPSRQMVLAAYEAALHSTRQGWSLW